MADSTLPPTQGLELADWRSNGTGLRIRRENGFVCVEIPESYLLECIGDALAQHVYFVRRHNPAKELTAMLTALHQGLWAAWRDWMAASEETEMAVQSPASQQAGAADAQGGQR